MTQVVSSISGLQVYAPSAGYAPTNNADVSAIASGYQVVSSTATQLYAGTAYLTSVNETPVSASRAGNAANASMANSAYYDGTGRLISSLPDSAAVSAIASSYAESAASGKQDTLTFAYDDDKISSINGSALAGQGGVTGDYVEKSATEVTIGSANVASYTGFAQGASNGATSNSFAQGSQNTATSTGFAQGYRNSANYDSFAQGSQNSAYLYSFAQGIGNSAKNTAAVFGRYNLRGNGDTTTGHSAAFVIGDGLLGARHDLMLVTRDGEITMFSSTADTTGTGIMSSLRAISAAATGGGVDSATVSAIASSYAESAASGKQDSGDYISANGLTQTISNADSSMQVAFGSDNTTAFGSKVAGLFITGSFGTAYYKDNELNLNRNDMKIAFNIGGQGPKISSMATGTKHSYMYLFASGNNSGTYSDTGIEFKDSGNNTVALYDSSTYGNITSVYDTVSANSASWAQAGVDSATVSAIASSYAESAVSSKLDESATADFYSTSNPSSFVDSAYVDSAVSGKADSSALSSYALSSDVSGVIDTVSSNSASWGGGGGTGDYVEKSASLVTIGAANTAEGDYAFAQGSANSAKDRSFAQGTYNSASGASETLGSRNNATDTSLAAGYKNTATFYSVAFGSNNSAQTYSFAAGGGCFNRVSQTSFAFGDYNTSTGNGVAFGYKNSSRDHALGFGSYNSASAYSFAYGESSYGRVYGFAFGQGVSARDTAAAFGTFNLHGHGNTSSGDSAAFVIGDGTDETARHDLMLVTKNGEITLFSSTADTTGTGIMSSIRAISAAATGGGGVDSATVSAIASAYVESGVSGKLDSSAFNSADFYTTANESGYVGSAYVESSISAYQPLSGMSSYAGAFSAGDGLEFVTSGDEQVLQVEAPVDIVAGPGIVIDNPDGNTLRVSMATDYEVVLWETTSSGVDSGSITVSEAITNFEKYEIYGFETERGGTFVNTFAYSQIPFDYSSLIVKPTDNNGQYAFSINMFCAGNISQWRQTYFGCRCHWNSTFTQMTIDSNHGAYVNKDANGTFNSINQKLRITKIVGIHRIANN